MYTENKISNLRLETLINDKKISVMGIIELCGWFGAIMLLIAYSANLLGKVKNDQVIFLVTNILGSGLLIINAYANKAYPFIIINVFWFLVSFYQLVMKNKKA